MKKLIAGAVCALAACGLPTLAAAEEGGFTLTGPAKIAMLYISPRNDGGWTRNPDPTDEQIRHGLEGNMCRCTGYQNIVRAVRYAAGTLAGQR